MYWNSSSDSCKFCEGDNYFKNTTGNVRNLCQKCPDGTISNVHKTGCVCENSNQTFDENNKDGCVCPKGLYWDESIKSCSICQGSNYVKNTTGNEEALCKKCPEGTFSNEKKTTCICDNHEYSLNEEGRCVCDATRKGPVLKPNIKVPLLLTSNSIHEPILLKANKLFQFNNSSNIVYIKIYGIGNEEELVTHVHNDPDTLVNFGMFNRMAITNFQIEAIDDCNHSSRFQGILFFLDTVVTLSDNVTEIKKNRPISVVSGRKIDVDASFNSNISEFLRNSNDEYKLDGKFWAVSSTKLQKTLIGTLNNIKQNEISIKWMVPHRWFGFDFFISGFFEITNSLSGSKSISYDDFASINSASVIPALRYNIKNFNECSVDGQGGANFENCKKQGFKTSSEKPICEAFDSTLETWMPYYKLTNIDMGNANLCDIFFENLQDSIECYPKECRRWEYSLWDDCSSATCNIPGEQKRNAVCLDRFTNLPMVNAESCNGITKYMLKNNRKCHTNKCIGTVLIEKVPDECTGLISFCIDKFTGRHLKPNICNLNLSYNENNEFCEDVIENWSPCSSFCNGNTSRYLNGGIKEERECNSLISCTKPFILALSLDSSKLVCVDSLFQTFPCPIYENMTSDCQGLCAIVGDTTMRVNISKEKQLKNGNRRQLIAVNSNSIGTKCSNNTRISTDMNTCCKENEELDHQGNCCSLENIDICGVCYGNSTVVDLIGRCCNKLDAMGYCCYGKLDILGVCNGIDYDNKTGLIEPVCGNNVCEIGEMCDGENQNESCCLDDCPFSLQKCPIDKITGKICAGVGKCLPSIGQCDCFNETGRVTGSDFSCSLIHGCRNGFISTLNGCVTTEAYSNEICENETHDPMFENGTDCGGICPKPCKPITDRPTSTFEGNINTITPTSNINEKEFPLFGKILVGVLIGLLFCSCCCCFDQLIELTGKRAKVKEKVEEGPQKLHSFAIEEDTKNKLIQNAEEETEEIKRRINRKKADDRLAVLDFREELLRKDIAYEGWLIKVKTKKKYYAVVKPIGELFLYKDMISSGFGNVHIHHHKTINLRDTKAIKLKGEKGIEFIRKISESSKVLKTYEFIAKDKKDANLWFKVLECLINMYKEQMSLPRKFRDCDFDLKRTALPKALTTSYENDWSLLNNGKEEADNRNDKKNNISLEGDIKETQRKDLPIPNLVSNDSLSKHRENHRKSNNDDYSINNMNHFLPIPAPRAPIPPKLPKNEKEMNNSEIEKKIKKKKSIRRKLSKKASISLLNDDDQRKQRSRSVPPPPPPYHLLNESSKDDMSDISHGNDLLHNHNKEKEESRYYRNNKIWEKFQKQI